MADDFVKFRCKNCDRRIGISLRHAGAHVRCPLCGAPTAVPLKSEPKRRKFDYAAKPSLAPAAQKLVLEYIKYYCKSCNRRIGVPVEHRGKDILCPLCGGMTPVPMESEPHRNQSSPEPGPSHGAGRETPRVRKKPVAEILEEEAKDAGEEEPDEEKAALRSPPAQLQAEKKQTAPSPSGSAKRVRDEPVSMPQQPKQKRSAPSGTFKKAAFTLSKLKQLSEKAPKPSQAPPRKEPAPKGMSLSTSLIIVGAFVLLALGVSFRKYINFHLFARPSANNYATRDQETVVKMTKLFEAVFKYFAARGSTPASLDELEKSKMLDNPDEFKSGGLWIFAYNHLSAKQLYNYEQPSVLLYEPPGAGKDGKRHILLSNGNVIAPADSQFDKYVEKINQNADGPDRTKGAAGKAR